MIASHAVEQPRKDPERCLRTRSIDGPFDQRATATSFPQPQWTHDQPREQSRLAAQHLVPFCQSNGRANGIDAASWVTREDQCHPVRHAREEPRPIRSFSRQEFHRAAGRAHHRRDIAGVEASFDSFGEKLDGELRVGS
jgi:hypothetical protein